MSSNGAPPVFSCGNAPPIPNNPANPTTNDSAITEPEARKLKRFVYHSSYDELLAKCVREHDAHKVGYGKKMEAFEAVRSTFIKSVPKKVFKTHEMPSVKSVRDRYIRLEERRRETVRKMEPLSGNVETVSDLDVLMDDLICEKDEFEENRRVERDEQTAREQQLNSAGATIRQLAISRKRRSTDVDDLTEDDTPKKNAKRSSSSVLEDVSTCMVESVERQKLSEEKKMDLEERRFLFEQERSQKDEARFQRTQQIAERNQELMERKQDLEEKRFELEAKYREERSRVEREEREGAREERRSMIGLIRSLMPSNR